MIKLYRAFLLLAVVLVAIHSVKGQSAKSQVITGNFKGTSFKSFVEQVEQQTNYRFFFEPASMDSVSINVYADRQELSVVLDKVFENTAFKYAIDADRRVFIIKASQLLSSLPDGFFIKERDTGANSVVPDYITDKGKQSKSTANSENKLYEIGIKSDATASGSATLAGTIIDAKTGEPIIGAVVLIEEPLTAVSTNQFGFYSIALPKGKHLLKIKSVGMKEVRRQIALHADGKLNIEMQEDVLPLKEVVVEAEKLKNVSGLMMGVEKLDIRTVKQVPTAFGEADILKVVLTLPGVKSVGESSTGLNVRGGATDQNLILFNDATIYNPSHLFGFFSAFNPDAVKGVELYKNSVPAKYGGRLSSVLEITGREGNKKEFAGSGGIGLISGRLTLEGPIVKDKSSFLIGGRSTYSDWLLKALPSKNMQNSTASFYDVNTTVSHEINDKNNLVLSGYFSKDNFKLGSDTLYSYSNQSATLRWNHVFSNNLYGVVTGGFSGYNYSIASDKNPVNAFELGYDLSQGSLKLDLSYYPNPKHVIDFGASSVLYNTKPGSLTPHGGESLVSPDILEQEKAIESAVYVGDQYEVNERLSVSLGIRYSVFSALGAKNVYTYASGLERTEDTIIDTVAYGAGDVIKTYHGPEYRLSLRYNLSSDMSVKLSYNRMRQYVHTLTNTAMVSPTDIWKLSDKYIRPQVGDQYAIGIFRNFRNNTIEASVETYYKRMRDFLDYKSGAQLILNHHIETDVINSMGKAYGVEAMLKKNTGKLNGWVSYTYSRSLVKSDGNEETEVINNGKYYPSNFDKPHDLTFVGNYRFSRRFSTSVNLTYSTGRPITVPLATYELGGVKRVYYSDRNQFRIPDYYRADIALNIEGNHKVRKLAHSSWTVSVYNITGRKNPYSIYFISEDSKIKGYKLSIFGQPIPTVTYNFKF